MNSISTSEVRCKDLSAKDTSINEGHQTNQGKPIARASLSIHWYNNDNFELSMNTIEITFNDKHCLTKELINIPMNTKDTMMYLLS